MDIKEKKILGNITDDIHKELFDVKNTLRLKSINETLKFLLDVYSKEKIEEDLKQEENINNIQNSNLEEIESTIKSQEIYNKQ